MTTSSSATSDPPQHESPSMSQRPQAGPYRAPTNLGGPAPRSNATVPNTTPAVPRRSAGGLPGLARTASALRQGQGPGGTTSTSTGVLSNLPAHLRSSTAPRVPSPLGKGTPGRQAQPKQSLPVRTSKTTQRHVLLPEEPQTKPLPAALHPTQQGAPPPRRRSAGDNEKPSLRIPLHEHDRTEAEKMTKAQREDAGLPRLTAYATAEGYRMKLLQAFLKREHGCGVVRVFDDAVYAVYNLPLLPGYGAGTKVRSSPAVKSPGGVSLLERMTEAEEIGYHDGFFPTVVEDAQPVTSENPNEYLLSTSPPVHGLDNQEGDERTDEERERERVMREHALEEGEADDAVEIKRRSRLHDDGQEHRLEAVPEAEEEASSPERNSPERPTHDLPVIRQSSPRKTSSSSIHAPKPAPHRRRKSSSSHARVADVVFFAYGVTVFFGLSEREEREILDDCASAGGWIGGLNEEDWEIESCHYEYMREASYPRIYNDMFTFISHSHLLKLSVSHAIAQSTKLSIHEGLMQDALAMTASFPKELAVTGELNLTRKEALKITGRLFRLRMDVNLSSAILDTPELFWSEASLMPLYEAIRDYLETEQRVQLLNDRLAVSGELLEIIHDYIDQGAMHRITWIVIILIVVAVIVAFGEVTARIIYFSTKKKASEIAYLRYILPRVPNISLAHR